MTTDNPSLSSQIILPNPEGERESEIFRAIADRDVELAERIEEVDGSIGLSISEIVPHFGKGTGPFTVHCVGGFVYCGDAGAAEVARIHPRDMILVMNGGEESPTYSFNIKKSAGSYGTANADPTVPYIEVDADDGTVTVTVYVSDGTTTRETEVFVVCQGTPS